MIALAASLLALSAHPAAGRSVDRRPIRVAVRGDPAAPVRLLVVGSVHGDEPAGIGIVRALERLRVPAGIELILVPDGNPDGHAAHRRGNARGVDLNRNFPYGWRPSDRGSRFYGGPRPLSEPESRFLARLVRKTLPTISIWFHQPYGLVDLSGGSAAIERRFGRLAGLPVRHLHRLPGTVTSWQNHTWRSSTSFVVELRAGHLSRARARALARAVLKLP